MKCPAYGTLVGGLNLKNTELGGDIVNAACDAMDEAIKTGDFRFMKYLVRP
jgi:hypothetical protein